MQSLENRVAVVTGAASGIGLALARHLVLERMQVVLADIEEAALEQARREFEQMGVHVHAFATDVSQPTSVQELAERAIATCGKVHVLCNNAGVVAAADGTGGIWERPLVDWHWMMGVNLMGVVHGLQAFVPHMLEHGEPSHIVNTASVLGVTSGTGSIYAVAKHALVRLTEGLYYDLRTRKANIGVSLLCPGLVTTNIVRSERNRPNHLRSVGADPYISETALRSRLAATDAALRHHGLSADRVAEVAVDAIKRSRLYSFTQPDAERGVRARMKLILEGLHTS